MQSTHASMHRMHCHQYVHFQGTIVVVVRSTKPQDFCPAAPLPAHGITMPIFRDHSFD